MTFLLFPLLKILNIYIFPLLKTYINRIPLSNFLFIDKLLNSKMILTMIL